MRLRDERCRRRIGHTRVVIICTQCGQENPDGFRFCGACGAPLVAGDAGQREERKVVTALFCDLVGFTSLSESADPEDVNTMLDGYAAMAGGVEGAW